MQKDIKRLFLNATFQRNPVHTIYEFKKNVSSDISDENVPTKMFLLVIGI